MHKNELKQIMLLLHCTNHIKKASRIEQYSVAVILDTSTLKNPRRPCTAHQNTQFTQSWSDSRADQPRLSTRRSRVLFAQLMPRDFAYSECTMEFKKNLQLLRKTPSSWLGSCRFKLPELEANSASGASSESTANSESTAFSPIYQQIDAQLKKYQVDAVLYIGGNDSMDTTDKLSRYFAQVESAVRVVGVPKTIDNDLEGTDHTPGFGSAARFVASVTAELTRDGGVYNTKNVTFIEAMGRDAGWLTAAGALAQDICGTAPDFVLLPEVSLDEHALISAIEQRLREKNNVIVVVSEGVHHADGSFLFDTKSVAVDTFGHLAAQSGTAQYLSQLVKAFKLSFIH